MRKLVIAEKPSVAGDLARALGSVPKRGSLYENDEYIISYAVGHLVELLMPEEIDKKYRYWRLEPLPIIPEKFDLKPIDKSKERFDHLKKLMLRKDVSEIINACDAGREGELIFTYIRQLSGCDKPVKRLWLQSMTPSAIRDAFKRLRDGDELRPLAEAARCRSESDWLIGINGTRAITKRLFGSKSGKVATVGRVQTPTLSIVMERERQIRNFTPRDFYRILATFKITNGDYIGSYQKPSWKKGDDEHDRADRLWSKEAAEAIAAWARQNPRAEINDEKKRSTQAAPRLYDLTTLQRNANNRFGFSARRTLQLAQALYERHKVITYPRTDSRALPEDYMPAAREALARLQGDLGGYAAQALDKGWVKPNKRIFNNAQVSDHFAIIPTNETPKKLSDEEAKIYDMVARQFVAAFYPPAQFDVTTRISQLGEHTFKTEGKVLVDPGWLAVHGKNAIGGKDDTLAPIHADDGGPARGVAVHVAVEEDVTRPPPRYNEATLLSAMEGAGKFVEEEEIAQAMKEKGLGTPATRAAIIDHLINEKYLERDQRDLVPTGKAESLLEFLQAAKVEVLTSPGMTGEWEYKLRKIEDGTFSRDKFMHEIVDLTKQIVSRAKSFEESDGGARETSIISPTDNKPMLETMRTYRSQSGDFAIYRTVANRRLDENEARELVEKRRVGPLDGFISRTGKPFSAILRLNDENKVEFVFDNGGSNRDGEQAHEQPDFSNMLPVGKCPKCGSTVYETASAYACERSAKKEDRCDFRVSRKILDREIPKEQMEKLLRDKKTDLIQKFFSKKSRKPFDAFLLLKETGAIGFEFPPRPPRAPKGKKAAAKGASSAKADGEQAPAPNVNNDEPF